VITSQPPSGAEGLRHAALFYRTPDELLSTVLEFVQAGVAAGEPVLVTSTGPGLQLLQPRLADQGELVTWAGLTGIVNPRRITAVMRSFAAGHLGRPIRYVQERVWPARPDQLREAIRHEALVNLALAGSPAAVLCAYDMRADAGVLTSAQRTHPTLVQDGRWRPSAAYAADVLIPEECDEPMTSPPVTAVMLDYRDDQAAVRRFAAEHARAAGLAPDRVRDLVLGVGELAGNTLMHTSGPGTLTMWTAGGEVLCQIQDSGKISDPLAGTLRPDPAAAGGGRGLWIVNQLCDLAEFRTGPAGTTIRLHIRLKPDEP
jgi:anti-sigma regulatory factor (Ser/Thr protein kinase)